MPTPPPPADTTTSSRFTASGGVLSTSTSSPTKPVYRTMCASACPDANVSSNRAKRASPCTIALVDRFEVGIAQRREARVGHADRRQLHVLDAARQATADRHAAAHEVDRESLVGHALREMTRAHQVADAEQVLHVDHD